MKAVLAIVTLLVAAANAIKPGDPCATTITEIKETPRDVRDKAVAEKANGKIIGCYWGVWSFYRPGFGQFDVDNVDTAYCTHGFYGFADLDNATWTVKIWDPWYDEHPSECAEGYCCYDSYRRFIKLGENDPGFVPMISIGGWNAGSGAYSVMAADPMKRKTFVDSVSDFLDKYPFDGVDLDWEYPGSREGSDPEHDKENFSKLVEEMSTMLKAKGKYFSAALSPAKKTVENAYDLPFLVNHFDFMNVMTYDYHGWFPDHFFTGHNAPIYRRVEEEPENHPGWYFNVFDSLSVYLDGGVPKDKIVMGIPLYGRGFVLNDTKENGLYCGAHAGIPMGPYTRQDGIWGYQEIMQSQNNDTLINLPDATPKGWTKVVDDCIKAPYAYNDKYWIGYDDPESVAIKVKFNNFMDLGGVMVWSIDTDDFRGDYGPSFGLMHAIHDTVLSDEKLDPENPMCTGTAPMCPINDDEDPLGCTEHLDVVPYPGDCHKYYMCLSDGNGGYTYEEYTCGDWVFDPNIDACTDPSLPSNDYLCGP